MKEKRGDKGRKRFIIKLALLISTLVGGFLLEKFTGESPTWIAILAVILIYAVGMDLV